MKGNIGHVTRLARSDAELAEEIADRVDRQVADLRLERMVAVNRRVLARGDRLAVRINLPDGRIRYT
jgi:hypothetical protein